MVPNRDAMMIFAIIDGFLRGPDAYKRSSVLESFPQTFEFIPWRRVYKQVVVVAESASLAHPPIVHWEASDLSFGGAGSFWCFTELQRSGENVSRKTEDGQTWTSKSGRGPKNGFPEQIRVDKLVITRKDFYMIELTLNQEKPMIALCKIWGKGNSAAASPQTPITSVFSPGSSTSSLQVFQDHFLVHEHPAEMQIDQFQGQMEGIAPQQHMPHDHESPIIGGSNIALPPDYTVGCIPSSSDDDSTNQYQDAVSFLNRMMESFKQVAIHRKDEARWIASTVQSAASTLKNTFKFLGINAEPENTRPCTWNTPVIEPALSTEANHAGLAPEMIAQGELPEQSYSREELMAQGGFPGQSYPMEEMMAQGEFLGQSYSMEEMAVHSETIHAGLAPEMMAQGELLEQSYSMEQFMAQGEFPEQSNSTLEESYFDVAMFLNYEGGMGANSDDPDEAM